MWLSSPVVERQVAGVARPPLRRTEARASVSDQTNVLTLVANRLDAVQIPYMVTGSIAASHYAEPRFTRDVDIVVELVPADAARIVSLFRHDFYVDEPAVAAAVARRGLVNLIHHDLLVKVDLIVRKNSEYRVEEFRRRRTVRIDDIAVSMVAPEDLVISKLVWMKESGSEVQRRDVQRLVEAVRDLDRQYIERWVAELTVLSLWREVAG